MIKKRKKDKLSSNHGYGSLEPRKMLASVWQTGSVLNVSGEDIPEVLSVRRDGNSGPFKIYMRDQTTGRSSTRTFFTNRRVTKIVMKGNGGNDQLVNRTNLRSDIYGGNGDDVVIGGTNNDRLFGQNGNDRMFGDFADTYTVNDGDGGDDFINGGNGDDFVDGKGGADTILGGGGLNNLRGGAGDDTITGGIEKDIMRGDDGDDILNGGRGRDQLFGGFGDDTLSGQEDTDFLDPGPGTDVAHGGSGNDLLVSRPNFGSSNTLVGGVGNDLYRFFGPGNPPGQDTIQERGSEGFDRVDLSGLTVPYVTPGGAIVAQYGLRSIVANPTGNIELVTDFSEVPQLDAVMTRPASGSVQDAFYRLTVTDNDGINVSRSNGIVSSLTIQLQRSSFGGPGQVTLRNLVPISKQSNADGSATFTYALADQLRAEGVRRYVPLNYSTEVSARQFYDRAGRFNEAFSEAFSSDFLAFF